MVYYKNVGKYHSYTNFTLNGETLKSFPLNSRTKQECPLSPLLLNIVIEFLTTEIKQEKETQGSQNIPIYKWPDRIPERS
jgi:hypothetical protein